MAAAISNTLLTRTSSANPLANPPVNAPNPLANPPAQIALTQAQNTGYGTSGAPMSVVPASQQTAPKPATTGAVAGTSTANSGSVVDYLNSQGKPSDYNSRAAMAKQYGIQNYTGTAEQNTQLLGYVKGGSAPVAQTQTQSTGITPAAGYMVDPNNKNGVIPISSYTPPPPQNTATISNTNGVAATTNANPAYNTTTNPVTYPSVVTDLTNASQPNSTQTGLINNLTGVANSNPLTQGAAYDTYSKAVQNLATFKQKIASQFGAMESGTDPLPTVLGREGALNKQYASQLEALQGAVNQAQAALGYGISEQQTQQSGLTSALGGANTQQAQTISGLGTAAGYSQPQLGAYGQGYYNPLTANSAGSNPYGTGPAAAANVQSIQDHTKTVNDWSAARQSATNIGNQLTSFLNQNAINPSDFNAVNKFLQTIGAQTSSPQYKQFYNLVTDLANTYAPVLGQGDASNYKVQLAQSLLDGTANGQSIPQILSGLDAQAQAKISGEQQIIQKLQNGENVNPSVTYNGVGGGTTSSNTISTSYGNINPDL